MVKEHKRSKLDKLLDYLIWLWSSWYFWALFIIDFLIRLPYGNLRSTHLIVYFIHIIDSLIVVTVALSVVVGLWNLRKYAKEWDRKRKAIKEIKK